MLVTDAVNEALAFYLLFGSVAALIFVERVMHQAYRKATGCSTPSTDRAFRFIGADLTIFAASLLFGWGLIFSLLLFGEFSIQGILVFLSQVRESIPIVGWIMTGCTVAQLFCPLFVGILLLVGRCRRRRKCSQARCDFGYSCRLDC